MIGDSLATRARILLREIDEAAHRVGRDRHSIRVVAVSKGHPVEVIRLAVTLGFKRIGENYVQEWKGKKEELKDLDIEWHYIGHLQSNKVKDVVGEVALIQSLDRSSLAVAIGRRAVELGIEQPVLVEINVAGEASKSGLSALEGPQLVGEWAKIPGLRLMGLMVMPPPSPSPEDSRPYFKQARRWIEEWRPSGSRHPWNELSMGTTQDFSVAIEEGATLIRLGQVLFGPRIRAKEEL